MAVSGGVDSAVAALLLKQLGALCACHNFYCWKPCLGHSVVGVHMSSWDAYEEGSVLCSSGEDLHSAELVCKHIGIELKRVSLVKEYWNNVFRYMHPLHVCCYEQYLAARFYVVMKMGSLQILISCAMHM